MVKKSDAKPTAETSGRKVARKESSLTVREILDEEIARKLA